MAQEEPVTVKQLNKEHIRAYMGKHTSASKSQIARELGLSFPTVGRLIDELCSDGGPDRARGRLFHRGQVRLHL